MRSVTLLLALLALLSCRQLAPAQATPAELRQTLAELTKRLEADPAQADIYHERGCVHFKLGNFKESVRDFDRCLELKPERKAGHWQRGISCFYAGRYDEGRKQFEGYQDFDSNDVENAVWRFLCMAKTAGAAKARREMLKIGEDRRVPMRQVYEMFKGNLKPADVLAAARAAAASDGKPGQEPSRPLFYAHLYVGIYYDLEGDSGSALAHLNKAAGEYRINHYMGDVARVHRDVLLSRHPVLAPQGGGEGKGSGGRSKE